MKKKKKKIARRRTGSSDAVQEKLLLEIVQLYREKIEMEVRLLHLQCEQAQG